METEIIKVDKNIKIKSAAEKDISFLLEQKDDLYETEEELLKMISDKNIYIFKLNNLLLGCGFVIKILNKMNYYDIGMWVNCRYRMKGYGSMIISYLKKYCLNNRLVR